MSGHAHLDEVHGRYHPLHSLRLEEWTALITVRYYIVYNT